MIWYHYYYHHHHHYSYPIYCFYYHHYCSKKGVYLLTEISIDSNKDKINTSQHHRSHHNNPRCSINQLNSFLKIWGELIVKTSVVVFIVVLRVVVWGMFWMVGGMCWRMFWSMCWRMMMLSIRFVSVLCIVHYSSTNLTESVWNRSRNGFKYVLLTVTAASCVWLCFTKNIPHHFHHSFERITTISSGICHFNRFQEELGVSEERSSVGSDDCV